MTGLVSGFVSGRTSPDVTEVATPLGPARVHASRCARPVATLVLGHGAGGGVDARDLAALAVRLPARRIDVLLVEQPWRVAGGRVAPAPARLDVAWRAVLEHLKGSPDLVRGSLVVGGRSAGARVACRTALGSGAHGVLALAFPLHPPGRPASRRADELVGVEVSTLVVQGGRDPFGSAGELPSGVPNVEIPWADHGFAVPRAAPLTQAEALDLVCSAVARWLLGVARSGAPER